MLKALLCVIGCIVFLALRENYGEFFYVFASIAATVLFFAAPMSLYLWDIDRSAAEELQLWNSLTDDQKQEVIAHNKAIMEKIEDDRRQDERHWMY